MQIMIFTTGGTIDKVYFDAKGGYEVGAPMVRNILNQGRAEEAIEVRELLRKDSLEMTEVDRLAIRDAVANWEGSRVIITHGTDTMVETARVLSELSQKTIVLTGALQPGRFADSDASFNLGMAVAAVQTLAPGVYITANGRIFSADRVRKNRELNRFEVPEDPEPPGSF
jgi:L-asparaginase